jgi:hypothetical protein
MEWQPLIAVAFCAIRGLSNSWFGVKTDWEDLSTGEPYHSSGISAGNESLAMSPKECYPARLTTYPSSRGKPPA